MRRSRFAALALFALAAGAVASAPAPAPAAPVPKHLLPKDEPLLYSVRAGDRHESTFAGKTIVCVVTKVEKTDDGTRVEVVEEHAGGPPTPYEVVVVSTAGVKQLESYGRKHDEPIWWVKLPHADTNAWTDRLGQANRSWKTAGWEEVEVPAGKFRAIRADRTDGPGGPITSYWWAPGIGCVKWSNGNTGREMTAFKPGK
jgi:hypothetical protein